MVTERLEDSQKESELSSLMKLAQGGDKKAYRELLEKVQTILQAFIKNSFMKMQNNNRLDVVDDVVQDTLLGIHAKRATYDPDQFFLPWMYAIARYKVIDHIRKQSIRFASSFDELKDTNTFYSEEIEPLTTTDLEKILSQLPQKQRNILQLVKIQGFSMQEVALQTGFSISDIKISVHRAMKSLKESVSDQG